MYQKQFLKFLELAKYEKAIFNDFFIKSFFDKLAELLNDAKNTHNLTHITIIFASIYGLDSFAQKIAVVDLTDLRNDLTKSVIVNYIKNLIKFTKTILEDNSIKNDHRIYDSLSEMLFLITKSMDIDDTDKSDLIEMLSNILLDFIKTCYIKAIKNYDELPTQLKNATLDYFALLIYLHNDKPDLIKKVIEKFAGLYSDIKEIKGEYRDRIVQLLYKELKLYSCWINIFNNLKEVNKTTISILKKDFYEPQVSDRPFASLSEKYGYPRKIGSSNGLWFLHPSYMWSNMFQFEISKKLNGDKGDIYIKFHHVLKDE